MTIREASDIANVLADGFSDVLVHAVKEPIFITARGHNWWPQQDQKKCKCEGAIRRARNITAGMRVTKSGDRYLCLGSDKYPMRSFQVVDTCMTCDKVLDYKEN